MFCLSCKKTKAETGCYLPASIIRVCLQCYRETVGSFPLPSGAASMLGGRFTDAKKLFNSLQGGVSTNFNEISRNFVSQTSGQNLPLLIPNEIGEAKAFLQDKLQGGVSNLMPFMESRINQIADGTSNTIVDKLSVKVGQIEGKLVSRADKLLFRVNSFAGGPFV